MERLYLVCCHNGDYRKCKQPRMTDNADHIKNHHESLKIQHFMHVYKCVWGWSYWADICDGSHKSPARTIRGYAYLSGHFQGVHKRILLLSSYCNTFHYPFKWNLTNFCLDVVTPTSSEALRYIKYIIYGYRASYYLVSTATQLPHIQRKHSIFHSMFHSMFHSTFNDNSTFSFYQMRNNGNNINIYHYHNDIIDIITPPMRKRSSDRLCSSKSRDLVFFCVDRWQTVQKLLPVLICDKV